MQKIIKGPGGTMLGSVAQKKESSKPEVGSQSYSELLKKVTGMAPEEVASALEAFVSRVPGIAEAHNDLAVYYYQISNAEGAEKHYQKAVELEPYNPIFLKNMADFYFIEKKQYEQALKTYISVLKLDPEDVEVLVALGLLSMTLERPGDAQSFLEKARELDPQNPDLQTALSQLSGEKKGEDGVGDLNTLHTKYVEGLKSAGAKNPLRFITAFLAQYPNFPIAHNDLGVLYNQMGNQEKALDCYRQAVHLAPENTTFRKNLADLYYIGKQIYTSAVEHYNHVIAQDHDDIEALFAIGRIGFETDDFDTASFFLNRILEIDPCHKDAQSLLSRIDRREGDDLEGVPIDSSPFQAKEKHNPENLPRNLQAKHRVEDGQGETAIYLLYTGAPESLSACLESLWEYSRNTPVYLLCSEIEPSLIEAIEPYWAMPLYLRQSGADETGLIQLINHELGNGKYANCILMDTSVRVHTDWLIRLIEPLVVDKRTAMVSPQFLSHLNKETEIGAVGKTAPSVRKFADSFPDTFRHRRLKTNQLDGACIAISADAFCRIGNLDERLGCYQSSVADWCFRARLKGKMTLVAGDIVLRKQPVSDASPKAGEAIKHKWRQIPSSSERGRALKELQTIEKIESLHSAGNVQALLDLVAGLRRSDLKIPLHREKVLEILIDLKKFELAQRLSDHFRAEEGDARLVCLYGYIKNGLGDVAAARRYAEKALHQDYGCALAWNLQGILAAQENEERFAEACFRAATAIDPGYGEPYANLATMGWDTEDPMDIFSLYERSFILSPTSNDLLDLYQKAIAFHGLYDRGIEMVTEAAWHHPAHRLLTYFLIDLSLNTGSDATGMQYIQQAILRYGTDDGILTPALKVRERLGPISSVAEKRQTPSLSVCLIVKDEAGCIAQCLQSVLGIADEIIVVDTGSSDTTIQIAMVFGAKVHSITWENDFSAARNVYLDKAKGDWILVLDADEVVAIKDHEKIRKLIRSKEHKRRAYTITTRNYDSNPTIIGWTPNRGEYGLEERGNGWIPTYKVRLFPNDSKLRYSFPVHEMLEPSLKQSGYELVSADVPIHHYGKLNSEKTKQKHAVYYELGLKKLEETGDDPYALRELAIQAGLLQRYEEAISLWERFIRQKPEIPEAYINMGTAYFHLGEYQRALENSLKAVELAPYFRESRYNHAIVLIHLGRAEEALPILEDLCQEHPRYLPGLFLLSMGYFSAEDPDSARQTVARLKATSLGPMLSVSFETFVNGLTKAEQFEYIHRVVKGAFDCQCGSDSLRRTLAKIEGLRAADQTKNDCS